MSRVTLLASDHHLEQRLLAGLGAERFAELVHHDPAQPTCVDPGADVVVIGPGMEMMEALCLAEEIERAHPEITTVLVAEPSSTLWELAMQAGVRYVVSPSDPPEQFCGAVDRALRISDRRRSNLVIDLTTPGTAKEASPLATPRSGRIIAVVSPKGGSGKTMVATNLASVLAGNRPNEVVLVDLDLQFGDVASGLRLDPAHTIAELPSGGELDHAALKLLLTPNDSGLYALCGSEDPATGEEIPAERIHEALRLLAADLAYVVVDTGAGLDAATLAAADVATDLVLVGSMDVPSIRGLRKLLDALDALGMHGQKRHVVLNRSDSRVGLDADDIVDILGLPITVSIPSSRLVPVSVNEGRPIVIGEPRSAVARPLFELASVFAPLSSIPTSNRRLFRRAS